LIPSTPEYDGGRRGQGQEEEIEDGCYIYVIDKSAIAGENLTSSTCPAQKIDHDISMFDGLKTHGNNKDRVWRQRVATDGIPVSFIDQSQIENALKKSDYQPKGFFTGSQEDTPAVVYGDQTIRGKGINWDDNSRATMSQS
jgi:hypothetical protein